MEQERVEPFGTGFRSPGQEWGAKDRGWDACIVSMAKTQAFCTTPAAQGLWKCGKSERWFPGQSEGNAGSQVFGFCRSILSYNIGASDMETSIEIDINCEVFDLKEHRNISNLQPQLDHPLHSGSHEHSSADKPLFTHSVSRDNLHHHTSHKSGCPPALHDKN
ncbi:hypothetical protein QTO34_014618 [Cnephaeus nilssonii]|uniref:Uncharacterized protein n=1 Tax=Cnephaeus nilssonii TaxID=3371016 RepID=A0AA40I6U3_CNENI|nr:hypothetical protein QTO34_014618 [Eptesicus nilssonii]